MPSQPETRVEYRVVADRLGGERNLVIADDLDWGLAYSYLVSYSRDGEYANVRIQKSESTPWVDVGTGEAE